MTILETVDLIVISFEILIILIAKIIQQSDQEFHRLMYGKECVIPFDEKSILSIFIYR